MYLLNLLFYGQDIRIDFSILLSIYDMCAKAPKNARLFRFRKRKSRKNFQERRVAPADYACTRISAPPCRRDSSAAMPIR